MLLISVLCSNRLSITMEERRNHDWNKGDCNCPDRHSKDSILYSLLSGNSSSDTDSPPNEREETSSRNLIPWLHNNSTSPLSSSSSSSLSTRTSPQSTPSCHYTPAAVRLCNPKETCQQVALLLLKTVEFVRTLPIHSAFPSKDRTLLFQHSWSELLALTMAQYKFEFEVEEAKITQLPSPEEEKEQTGVEEGAGVAPNQLCPQGGLLKCLVAMKGIPTKCDVDTMNTFFRKCDTMMLDDKEFAYLKATIFFSSDVPGLVNPGMVESHQSQAQLRLGEYETAMYPTDPLRFAHILLSLPPLRNIRSKVITQLFFQDLIGDAPMEELLKQMLANP
ncbi:nuclear receptor subfamily 0 group B member 2-like isoform X2 [Apostichopus japonicus]|uniref:nuclear receptor subfamily 0 group B member 2-like isoform X2 n=1 Tax=Stichopus japonicus TaxID=307972 RepID=UPI003AB5D835